MLGLVEGLRVEAEVEGLRVDGSDDPWLKGVAPEVRGSGCRVQDLTGKCSGFEAGSYLRLIGFV